MYGVLPLLIALTRLALWLYATNRPHLVFEPIDRRTKTLGVLIVVVPAALYLLAILIAIRAPVASLGIYVVVQVLYFIALFIDRTTEPPGSEEEEVFT
jgi:hypothetical protein